jgi:hypothetical protein
MMPSRILRPLGARGSSRPNRALSTAFEIVSIFPPPPLERLNTFAEGERYSCGTIAMVSTAPNIRTIDHRHCVASWDRVLILLWRREATVEAVQSLLRVGRVFITENAGHLGSILSVIESQSPPPADSVRRQISVCYRELGPGMRYNIVVAEGGGFRAAIVRGVGLTVSAFAPSLLPFKFASSVDEAAAIIAPGLSPKAGGAAALKTAVISVRMKLDERAPL